MIEKLDKFYRTRADFPDWMSEDEWHKKEVEIIKECLEPQIRQNLESLLNGIKCPLSMSVMYNKENGVQVDILCQGKDIKSQDNKDRQRVHRSESTGFVVQFPDGTMVQRSKAKDTLVATLKVIGLNRVAAFRGKTFAGTPLVTRNRRTDGDNKWQEEVDGWYVYVNMSNAVKIDVLRQLSKELRLGLVIKKENGDKMNSEDIPHKSKRQLFSIDGKGSFNKRNCVLETVKKYMKSHPNTTSKQLQLVFPPELQGGYGVVRSISWIQHQHQLGKDFMDRYFIDPDSFIQTFDGEQLVVSNQWGDQFQRFINAAKEVGIGIEKL